MTTPVSHLLAYPLAWIICFRVPQRWQRAALLLAILTFRTSYRVRSHSWLPTALRAVGLDPGLLLVSSRTGTVIGFVHFFTMPLTLTSYTSLAQIPPNCLRAAADLASSWQTLWAATASYCRRRSCSGSVGRRTFRWPRRCP